MALKSAIFGTVGVTAIEGINQVPPTSGTVEIVKIVLQIIVGIGSLVAAFRKSKPKNDEQQ